MSYLKLTMYITALALIAGVLRFAYTSGYDSSERKWNDKYTKELSKANDDLIKAKRDLLEAQAEQAELESKLLAKQKEQADNAQNIIDDLSAGNIRLRESLKSKTCPSVPSTNGGTSSSDATSTGGLSKEDVEFLIREASRADQYAEQLTAAQQVITSDRSVCRTIEQQRD